MHKLIELTLKDKRASKRYKNKSKKVNDKSDRDSGVQSNAKVSDVHEARSTIALKAVKTPTKDVWEFVEDKSCLRQILVPDKERERMSPKLQRKDIEEWLIKSEEQQRKYLSETYAKDEEIKKSMDVVKRCIEEIQNHPVQNSLERKNRKSKNYSAVENGRTLSTGDCFKTDDTHVKFEPLQVHKRNIYCNSHNVEKHTLSNFQVEGDSGLVPYSDWAKDMEEARQISKPIQSLSRAQHAGYEHNDCYYPHDQCHYSCHKLKELNHSPVSRKKRISNLLEHSYQYDSEDSDGNTDEFLHEPPLVSNQNSKTDNAKLVKRRSFNVKNAPHFDVAKKHDSYYLLHVNSEYHRLPQKSVSERDISNSPTVCRVSISESLASFNDELEHQFESALEIFETETFDSYDEAFGRAIFDEDKTNYFVDAYNKDGNELVVSYTDVERKMVDYNSYESKDTGSTRTSYQNESSNVNTNTETTTLSNVKPRMTREKYWSLDFDFADTYEEEDVLECYNIVGNELCKTVLNKNSITNFEKSYIHEGTREALPKNDLDEYMAILSNQCEDEDEPVDFSYINAMCVEATSSEIQNVDQNVELSGSMDDIILPPSPSKTQMIIKELLDTEKGYLSKLEFVVKNYMESYFKTYPTNLHRKLFIIFGNIEQIYDGTKILYLDLFDCGFDSDKIARTFLSHKKLFDMYPTYLRNKPLSDYYVFGEYKQIIKEKQEKLNDRLDLSSYLLNPIQRLGRYILLLENLKKSLATAKCETLTEAIQFLKKTMKRGNDYVAIDSIARCPKNIDFNTTGSFILREKFNMLKPRKGERMLFLFDKMIVLTVVDQKNSEKFIYRESIMMNDLSIVTIDGEDQIFHLRDYPKCKNGEPEFYTYVLEAKDKKLKQYWTDLINEKLWEQLKQYKDGTKKIASKNTKSANKQKILDRRKDSSGTARSFSKNKKRTCSTSSTFYVEENYGTL